MRLFASIDLPDDLAPAIAAIQDEFDDAVGINCTDPEQAHVTLKFLGETDPGRLDDLEAAIESAVREAGVGPFEASFDRLGAFPSEEYIRVVWLGVGDGGRAMTRLHEAIEDRTVSLGFDPEEHDFTPHVTLARMEHAGGKERVQRVLGDHEPAVGSMAVEEVRLTESELGPSGPSYTTVERFPLPDS